MLLTEFRPTGADISTIQKYSNKIGHAPNHVIAHSDIIQRLIQPGNARQYLVKRSHGMLPLSDIKFSAILFDEFIF